MQARPFESIIHPTDFSAASEAAFAHALRIAIATKADFRLLHVEDDPQDPRREPFPPVRETLAQWKLLEAGASESAVAEKLGIQVSKSSISAADTRHGLLAFLARHSCDLMVLASHERSGLRRWFGESLGERTARDAHVSTLFVRENQRGFVDRETGTATLANILLPVDGELRSASVWRRVASLAALFEPRPRLHLLHVGASKPVLRDDMGEVLNVEIDLREGPVIDTILAVAQEIGAELIAMPTAGHDGVLDALRGSTTERVLHEAPCPVLAVPALA